MARDFAIDFGSLSPTRTTQRPVEFLVQCTMMMIVAAQGVFKAQAC
jgi:hypothetical protein